MIDPVLVIAVSTGGFAALILFAVFARCREIRGRLLPLCILTLIHALMVLSCFFFSSDVLRDVYLFSPLFLLLSGMIYTAALSEFSRMTRPLGISCFVFIANTILQGLLAFVVSIGGYTG